ncbi:hypothetical protein BGX26_009157 [Mortierella sp. AD094]|nr:hypothetical protein BGX26_009157 [Mortierella sp. AD094]
MAQSSILFESFVQGIPQEALTLFPIKPTILHEDENFFFEIGSWTKAINCKLQIHIQNGSKHSSLNQLLADGKPTVATIIAPDVPDPEEVRNTLLESHSKRGKAIKMSTCTRGQVITFF